MLEIAKLPLAQRLWRISKLFGIPLNDERMQNMTPFELEFYEYSSIVEDPEKLKALENRFYDDEYDEWEREFDEEQARKAAQQGSEVDGSGTNGLEDYDVSAPVLPDEEWEPV